VPRIKRWFPVSHDINRDPDLWDLEEQFGSKILRIWLELLSIADRNEGEIPGELNSISTTVAWAVHARSTTVQHALDQMMTKGWLHIDGSLKVTKWAKYHRTREHHLSPSEPDRTRPNLTRPKERKAPTAQPDGFAEFWSLYPKKKSKGDAEKAWKTLNPNSELLAKILNAVRRAKSSHDWLKQSGQFIPHPATWLRAHGWEDEGVNFTEKKEVPAVVPKKPTDELPLTPEQRHENIKLVHEMLQGLKRVK